MPLHLYRAIRGRNERDDADRTVYLDARVGRCLSGCEVVGREHDSPLLCDRNRGAFSGIQFFSSDSAFLGFDEFPREVCQPIRNTTGVDRLVTRLRNEERVNRREQFERIDLGDVNRAVPRPRQSLASRVQAPVDVFLDDLTLSVHSFDFRPTDVLDGFLAVEFAIEVLCEHEVSPQIFEPAFECPLEYFGLWKAAGFSDFSYPVGNLGGHAV
jgi:hypothetical protein